MSPAETARLDGMLASFGAGLAVADLPPGTAEDLLHYRSQTNCRGRAIQTLCRAIAAAKRSGGLGIVSDCTAAPAYVGVCRHGVFSRVLEIGAVPDGLALEVELMRLAGADQNGMSSLKSPAGGTDAGAARPLAFA